MRLPPADVLHARAARLRQALDAERAHALVVTSLPNIAYLTGFFASAGAVVVVPDSIVLIADARYREALAERVRACAFIRGVELAPDQSFDQAIVDVLAPLEGLTVGFEAAHLTVSRHLYLTRTLEQQRWTSTLLATDGLVERQRAVKDAWELERLRDGGERLSTVAKCILPKVLAGRTEAEVAAELEVTLRAAGFERVAFDTIVASGPNAALPHARAGSRQIAEGDLVVVDFGGVLDGYCTDLTRTVAVGQVGARAEQVLAAVREAQLAAVAAVRGGVPPEAVDAASRSTLAAHGMGEAFTHGTGHGLGLEVHEAPRVTRARAERREPPLAPGMVMTIEPGAYFPGWGGVRIEDDIVVTSAGAEWLTDPEVR